MNVVIRQLWPPALIALSDRELVEALVARADEAAFEMLLRRHGPMVLAVCRRVLGNSHDAEDAFQSRFLVLIRKASKIRKPEALASWLYGVAYLTARKARQMNARREAAQARAALRQRSTPTAPNSGLDEEINSLPEKYRLPIVMCALEGRTRKEAARQLNIPEGTLSSRLATARNTLARRLRRRGWTLADVSPASALPGLLVGDTLKMAARFLIAEAVAEGVPSNIIALSQGVLKAMLVQKLKTVAAIAVMGGATLIGVGGLAHLLFAGSPRATVASQDPVQTAAADLAAAKDAAKQAEARLSAARAKLARKQAAYDSALCRLGPSDEAARNALMHTIAKRLKYRIPFEVGLTDTTPGGSLEITDVWGTRPQIEAGGVYLVHGKYTLLSHQRGKLYFHLSAKDWNNGIGPNIDLQAMDVEKGQGEFTLMHEMIGPGYFHLHLVGPYPERYDTLANVYFGTGGSVLRKK